MTHDKPSYFVKDGHTLGYVDPCSPTIFCVLAGKPQLGGHDWKNGPTTTYGADLVPATLADFERFRVSPVGHLDGEQVA